MEVEIIISLDGFDYCLCGSKYDNKYELSLILEEGKKINDYINNKTRIDESIEAFTNAIDYDVKLSYKDVVENIKYITFECDNEEKQPLIDKFISDNKEELKKYIVVPYERVNLSNYKEIEEKYKDFNFLVKAEDSDAIISINQYIETSEYLTDLVNTIKSLNLSPLENTILVYDLVRDKVYRETDLNDCYDSRDVYKIMSNDKIVCAGYTALFNRLLKSLGEKAIDITLSCIGRDSGHARSCIYIDDSKYNVKGIFFLDPTFDSKKSDDDSSYLYLYRNFLKPFSFFESNNWTQQIGDETFKFFAENGVECLDEAIELVKDENKYLNFNNYLSAHGCLSALGRLMYDNGDTDDNTLIEKLEEDEELLIEYLNSKIYLLTFIKALTHVRSIENACDSEKYPFDLDKIFANKDRYGFSEEYSIEDKLLQAIFGNKEDQNENIYELYEKLKSEYSNIETKDVKKLSLYKR